MIVKLNSKNDVQAEGIFHQPEVHWLTNPNNSLHVHVDPSWSCWHKALRWIETLNTGIENPNEPGQSTLEVYHQQLPCVESWELPNPFQVGHYFAINDPYYDNHDPDVDLDDDWYQGRDGWD